MAMLTMRFWVVTPLANPVLITAFIKMISVNLTVKSSSFLLKALKVSSENEKKMKGLQERKKKTYVAASC